MLDNGKESKAWFTTKSAKLGASLRFPGNSLSRERPKAVLSPFSYQLSRRRRQRKRLLLEVPYREFDAAGGKLLRR